MVRNQGLTDQEGLTAVRRKFLMDLAWPVSSDLLCRMFGLLDTSQEVGEAEQAESAQRMSRLADDDMMAALVVSAAQDAATIMALVDDPEERTAWLTTYALAVVNLLEEQGKLAVL